MGVSGKGYTRWRCAVAAMASVLTFAAFACALAFPSQAHATFKDASDSYPAAQDLGSYGNPIYGDQLPDGAYKVTARTSSRMCIMYTNPDDAEARDSKEQAIITVSGGNITVMFYISKAYTHLFMGTADAAAAATNDAGTDASAYIAGDPPEGYVPHLFALYVPSLNTPMTLSTFSGGDHGIEEGKWYTREVVFVMTDAELQAAIAAASGEGGGEGEAEQSEASGQAASATDNSASTSGSGGSGDGSTLETKAVWTKGSEEGITFTFKRPDDENTFSLFDHASVDGARLPQSAYTARAGSLVLTLLPDYLESLDVGGHVIEVAFSDGQSASARFVVEEKAGEAAPSSIDTIGTRGVLLNGVTRDASALDAAQAAQVQDTAPGERFVITPQLVAAIALVLLFIGGAAWRAVRFSQSFEAGKKEIQGC